MANIMTKTTTSILWLVGLVLFILIGLHSGWKIAGIALGPLIATTDLAIWFIASLTELPCGFVQWVCYPFWPVIREEGFPMRWGVIIRIAEIAILVGCSAWLAKVVKSVF